MADDVELNAAVGTFVADSIEQTDGSQRQKVAIGAYGDSEQDVMGDLLTAVGLLGTEDTAGDILAKLSSDPATQTTVAAILAKIIAAPATEAKQDTLIGHVDGLEGAFTTLNGKDFATQTTLAAVLAKIISAPATEAKQDSAITQETAINTILGVSGDAASTTTTIKAALRGIATALGITAFDLGSGTGGSRTLRWFHDTAQWVGGSGSNGTAVQRVTIATDDATAAAIVNTLTTVTTTVTRPSDSNAYAVNDVWANSTSSPTTGGFTFASAGRASGKGGIITDAIIVSSGVPSPPLQGEIWIFDSAVTAVNDNAAFALSDSDALKLVGVIPFALGTQPSNAIAYYSNLGIGFTPSGSADLRFLIKVTNAYAGSSAETLTVRLKIAPVG